MAGVPYTFGSATTSIPLSQLDSNFTTPVTIGSTTVALGNTVASLAGLTSVTTTGDSTISGLTVGKGGGAVSNNTVVGNGALAATSGGQCTAIGNAALAVNTATNNTAVGTQALTANTSGVNNDAFGYATLYTNTTGTYNTAIGGYNATSKSALFSNTSGSYNIAVGNGALQANTTASNNTAVGYQAGYSTTTGTRNTAVGASALFANTTGENTGIGYSAGSSITTGTANAFVGGGLFGVALASGNNTTTGSYNTGLGHGALGSNTTASSNTAVGYQAGYVATGGNNSFLGYQAGNNLTSGVNNIYIGNAPQASSTGAQAEIAIGNGITGKGTQTAFIGGTNGSYQQNNSAAWSITSDQRLKKNIVDHAEGLDKIIQLRVRNFEYRLPEEVTELEKQNAIDIKGVQLGLIAQELAEVLPDCVKTESTGVMSVDATNITWHMINAIKDLKAINDSQASTITELTARIVALESK